MDQLIAGGAEGATNCSILAKVLQLLSKCIYVLLHLDLEFTPTGNLVFQVQDVYTIPEGVDDACISTVREGLRLLPLQQ